MGISSALGSSALLPAGLGFRNLIINGGMQIHQRGTAAESFGFGADRWQVLDYGPSSFSVVQNADAPAGFSNSLRLTVNTGSAVNASALAYMYQKIEGFNTAQLAFGTSSAKPITLSFWVRSSVVGTYSVSFDNGQGPVWSYVSSYSVAVANTWEKKVVTIPGATIGSWGTGNITGLGVSFGLQIGSNYAGVYNEWKSDLKFGAQVDVCATTGNIFAITGVQLEQNLQPTPFEQRPIGVELALCQRYYQTSYPYGTALQALTNVTDGATFICINTSDTANGGPLPTAMRGAPQFATYSSNGGVAANSARNGSGVDVTGITLVGGNEKTLPRLNKSAALGVSGTPFSAHWTASAEL